MELSIPETNKRNILFPDFKVQGSFPPQENSLQFPSNSFPLKTSNHLEEILNTITTKLKTQLSNISLASELLETSLLSGEQQMFVAIIRRGSENLRDLIADIKLTTLKNGLRPESLSQVPFSSY